MKKISESEQKLAGKLQLLGLGAVVDSDLPGLKDLGIVQRYDIHKQLVDILGSTEKAVRFMDCSIGNDDDDDYIERYPFAVLTKRFGYCEDRGTTRWDAEDYVMTWSVEEKGIDPDFIRDQIKSELYEYEYSYGFDYYIEHTKVIPAHKVAGQWLDEYALMVPTRIHKAMW